MKITTRVAFLFILLVELLSALVVFFPGINGVVAVLLALGCLVLTCIRPEWGMTILATELVIGSKGGLFRLGADSQNNGGIAIRILLFSACILGWLVWSIRHKTWKEWPLFLRGRVIYGGLTVLLLGAFLHGLLAENLFVFADANSWGMWLLLVPMLDVIAHRKEELKKILYPTIQAALLWLPIKTLLLFYFFSHAFPPSFLDAVYLWIRRTGVGEITRASGTAYRVFFQSHIYAVGVVLALWCKQIVVPKLTRNEWALLVLSLAEVLVSLSRSLWLGLAAGTLVLFFWFCFLHRTAWKRVLMTGICSTALAILLATGLLMTPFPRGDGSLLSLVRTRIDAGEDAATSRWQLLPILWSGIKKAPIFGSGFGATLTYQSHDPRIVRATGGMYTTYAFEWGWFDFWYKLGIIGILIIGMLLFRLGRRVWRIDRQSWMTWAIISGLVALITVHFFTPYLNHPLGFGLLLVVEGCIFSEEYRSQRRIDKQMSSR